MTDHEFWLLIGLTALSGINFIGFGLEINAIKRRLDKLEKR